MTESEWLLSRDAQKLTKFLPQPLSRRKCLLAVCGYGRRIETHIPYPSIVSQLAITEEAADGTCTVDNSAVAVPDKLGRLTPRPTMNTPEYSISISLLYSFTFASLVKPYIGTGTYQNLRTAVTNIASPDSGNFSNDLATHTATWLEFYKSQEISQADIIRDIFGNPFHPTPLNPSWLTSTVIALANGIYDEKAFDRMPILADALMDGDCDSEEILNHCRQPGEHVRGCWVIDLLLSKQ